MDGHQCLYIGIAYLLSMEHTYLPEKAPTKREQIRDLVLGDHTCAYSADDIARIVQTTKENVWKEKSRMGNEGLLVRRRTLNVSAEGKEETMPPVPSVGSRWSRSVKN